MTQLSGYI